MKIFNQKIFLMFITSLSLLSQEIINNNDRNFQVTFAYPIGSNGIASIDKLNNFSLNLLYGVNGGVNGFEIGSIFNFNKGAVKGVQLSGISNINTGKTSGFLISGILNVNMESTSGLLLAGVLNYSKDNSNGFQLSIANIASNEMNGFQLGIFNYSKKLKGTQLGIINYTSECEKSLPIGLISIVKNGLFELEVTGNELLFANINFKMGVNKFYTIYKTGYSVYKNKPVFSYGLGIGSKVLDFDKSKISLDFSVNQIVFNNNFKSKRNILGKVDFNYQRHISDKFSLLLGPSLNLYVSNEKVDGQYGTLTIPYTIYTRELYNGKLFSWIGFNAGLSLKI